MGQTPYLKALWGLLSPTDAQHAKKCCHASPQWQIDVRCLTQPSPWIGSRLIAWPSFLRHRRRIGVASSRLGRKLDQHRQWFAELRHICESLGSNDMILSAAKTTTGRFLTRCHQLWQAPVTQVQPAPTTLSINEWFAQLSRTAAEDSGVSRILLSPPLKQDDLPNHLLNIPLTDRAIAFLSHHLHVLHLRRNGHWDQLLRMCLCAPRSSTGPIFLRKHSTTCKLTNELSSLGAIIQEPVAVDLVPPDSSPPSPPSRKLVTALPSQWSYLTHCTRRCNGPWPNQSEEAYLDSLLLGQASCDRSPLSTLSRIVRQGRLIASSATNRAGINVVSFTEVPLAELPMLRTFRSHRARWDFEPYGICIDRHWLTQNGTKPVIYGENATWHRLPHSERPFFQKSKSEGAQPVDWTVEREWRHIGDVEFQALPEQAVLLFVPDHHNAVLLASFSPWPVFALDTVSEIH